MITPDIVKKEVFEAANAIYDLYQTWDGAVGGIGHIVFDDDNFDMVERCLKDKDDPVWNGLDEETRELSIKALTLCSKLSEDEVAIAVSLKRVYEDVIREDYQKRNGWK